MKYRDALSMSRQEPTCCGHTLDRYIRTRQEKVVKKEKTFELPKVEELMAEKVIIEEVIAQEAPKEAEIQEPVPKAVKRPFRPGWRWRR